MADYDGFGIDLSAISLDALQQKLALEELLPGHRILRDGLEERFATLSALPVSSVQDLVNLLPTSGAVARVAAQTGIAADYLTVLRRHVRGLIPAPVTLAEIPETNAAVVEALAAAGIRNSRQLYLRARTRNDRDALCSTLGIEPAALTELLELTDLSRLGWMGPIGVRWFHSAGVTTVAAVAAADPDALHARLVEVNRARGYTKATLGRKDVASTVAAARRLPATIEF